MEFWLLPSLGVATYMKVGERKALVRRAARELLAEGTPHQELSLRAVAGRLGWSLGTLHRAYSVTKELLNDLVLEYEDQTNHAVYQVGVGGLELELTGQAQRMRVWMADGANEQVLRYQMTLGCRSEVPVALPLRGTRNSSWEYHRDMLVRISVAAGEEYSDLNGLASLMSAIRDGSTYQFFHHRDLDRWLDDNLLGISLAVAFAQPRKVSARTSLVDQLWISDKRIPSIAPR